jgi:serpin B
MEPFAMHDNRPLTRRRFHNHLCGMLALLGAGTQQAFGLVQPFSTEHGPVPQSDRLQALPELTAATNAFALRLLARLDPESGENAFVSPLSIQLALCMALEGARGRTASEMGRALQFPPSLARGDDRQPWNMDVLRQQVQAFDEWSRTAGAVPAEEPELQMANALWVDKAYPLEASYAERLAAFYGGSKAEEVDFGQAPDVQRQRINQWVSDNTRDKIQELLAPGTIDRSTQLVIANAIYFKGVWKEPFDVEQTRSEEFSLAEGSKISAPMMHARQFSKARYAAFHSDGQLFPTPGTINLDSDRPEAYPAEDGFQVVELDYSGDDISMLLLLPMSVSGLPALLEGLTDQRLASITSQLAKREVHLTLPKFKMESSYELNAPLQELGMQLAFTGQADFSGMTSSLSAEDRLMIALVAHKAFVEVNEQGTEAAAATGVVMSRTSISAVMPFIPEFRADHPFLFIIRERHSGLILFVGRLEKPDSQ